MKNNKSNDEKRFLQNVEPEWRAFWFHMGTTAKNLREFEQGLRMSSEETFKHHVTGAKNDFSTWVKEIIGDEALAKSLAAAKTAKAAADKVAKRIAELEADAKVLVTTAVKEAKRGAKK